MSCLKYVVWVTFDIVKLTGRWNAIKKYLYNVFSEWTLNLQWPNCSKTVSLDYYTCIHSITLEFGFKKQQDNINIARNKACLY